MPQSQSKLRQAATYAHRNLWMPPQPGFASRPHEMPDIEPRSFLKANCGRSNKANTHALLRIIGTKDILTFLVGRAYHQGDHKRACKEHLRLHPRP